MAGWCLIAAGTLWLRVRERVTGWGVLSFRSPRRCGEELVPRLARHRDTGTIWPLGVPYKNTGRYERGLHTFGRVAAAVRRLEPDGLGNGLGTGGHSQLLAGVMDHGGGSLHVQRLRLEVLERKSVSLQFLVLLQEE